MCLSQVGCIYIVFVLYRREGGGPEGIGEGMMIACMIGGGKRNGLRRAM